MVAAAVFGGLNVGCIVMADPNYCERASEILALAKAEGFPLTERQLADWHRKGLLPQPKQVALGRGRGTVTCYPDGTIKQAHDLLRLRKVYGRNFEMIGWMLAMGGYDVEPQYWREPVKEAMNDWRGFLRLTDKDDDGALQISEYFYDLSDTIPWPTMKRTPIGPLLQRLRAEYRETFLGTLMNVRLGHPAITNSWDNQTQKADLDIIGLALGLQQPRKKRKKPFEYDDRTIEVADFRVELDKFAVMIARIDLNNYVKNLSDKDLLIGLQRFSPKLWITINNLLAADHRFAKSAVKVLFTDKPKLRASVAVLGAFYFDLFPK